MLHEPLRHTYILKGGVSHVGYGVERFHCFGYHLLPFLYGRALSQPLSNVILEQSLDLACLGIEIDIIESRSGSETGHR